MRRYRKKAIFIGRGMPAKPSHWLFLGFVALNCFGRFGFGKG
jgi:hypothetical protein